MVVQLRKALFAFVVAVVVAAGALPSAASPPPATASGPEAVPGELLVRFEPGTDRATRADLRARQGLEKVDDLPVSDLELVRITDGERPDNKAATVARQRGVRYAEPNYVVRPTSAVDDEHFDKLWGLHNTGQTGGTADADIDAPEAWDLVADTSGVVVGVIDTGVDISHPDLAANIWTNSGEIPGNGIDDDGNGYIDDVNGWDFYNSDASVYDPDQGDTHGTHVAGTIAAVADNGIGVAGVSQAQIMPIKFLGPDGGHTANAVRAIDYAIQNGAHVTNNSWGGGGYSQSLADAIAGADDVGQLFVAAAGNGGGDGVGDDVDLTPTYPAAYPNPNVIAVAATTSADLKASYSNYGASSVDLGAPGSGIVSTVPGSSYASYSGTSMASPHVAGAVVQVIARYRTLSHTEVRDRLLATVDPVVSLDGVTVTGGRLNLGAALGVGENLSRFEESASGFGFGLGWHDYSRSHQSGGNAKVTNAPGATVSFEFSGTAVRWIGEKGPNRAIGRVVVDGVDQGVVDTYASTWSQQVELFTVVGLDAGAHTITITWDGYNPSASTTSPYLNVDAIDVQ